MIGKARLITEKDELEGTCYFEILPGKYKGECWNEGSVFLDEEVFGYLEPIIEKHEPTFDHYAFVEIPEETWRSIIADFRHLMTELPAAKNTKDLQGRVGFIFRGSKNHFADQFEENKRNLQELLGKLVIWLEDALEKHEEISVLGI